MALGVRIHVNTNEKTRYYVVEAEWKMETFLSFKIIVQKKKKTTKSITSRLSNTVQ